MLFPEGHESVSGDLMPLQGGPILLAVRTGSPILPVGIVGTQHMVSPRTFSIRRAAHPALLQFGKPIPVDVLTGGLGRAAIVRGVAVLGEAIRECRGNRGTRVVRRSRTGG